MNAKQIQNNYNSIKAKYPDVLLLLCIGSNVIALKNDANIVAKICGIQKTNTIVKFSYNKLNDYLSKLIRNGYRIAICQELSKPNENDKKRI